MTGAGKPRPGDESGPKTKPLKTSSRYHGKQQYDYQGRSWLEPPRDLKPDDGDHTCYVPKRHMRNFAGHNAAVQSIQLFPRYGHMLLSGSSDNKIKIWDVAGTKHAKRTYEGHTKGLKEVRFKCVLAVCVLSHSLVSSAFHLLASAISPPLPSPYS